MTSPRLGPVFLGAALQVKLNCKRLNPWSQAPPSAPAHSFSVPLGFFILRAIIVLQLIVTLDNVPSPSDWTMQQSDRPLFSCLASMQALSQGRACSSWRSFQVQWRQGVQGSNGDEIQLKAAHLSSKKSNKIKTYSVNPSYPASLLVQHGSS